MIHSENINTERADLKSGGSSNFIVEETVLVSTPMHPYPSNGYKQNDTSSKGGLDVYQQQKVVDHLKMVKWIVHRIVGRLPRHIDAEDLMHSGILGLIDAVQRFQWGRANESEEFRAYAECRIRGQVMDELRRMDILPRSVRDKINHYKKVEEGLRKSLNRDPEDQEVSEAMGVDLDAYHRVRAQANGGAHISLDHQSSQMEIMEGVLKKTLNLLDSRTPEGIIHIQEVKKILANEIEKLSERERQVISLYYLEEMTLKEIGSILSITESRVSQIHAQSLGRLMHRLKVNFGFESFENTDFEEM